MEVLASTNRMSAITFLSLYFLRKHGTGLQCNTKGPAFESTREFLIMYILTFACVILFLILFKIHFVHILWNLHQLYIFTGIFVQLLCIGHIIIRLYWAACETGQFQAPMPKAQDNKPKKYRQ